MLNLVGGVDANGVRSLEFADLQRLADEWRTSAAVPSGVASLLETSRALFTHSWFVYDFMAVSVAWSLVAVEAALREALGPVPAQMNLKDLIGAAEREGRISREWADRLDAARRLRNGFAHADRQRVFTLGMAAPAIAAAHEVCELLAS